MYIWLFILIFYPYSFKGFFRMSDFKEKITTLKANFGLHTHPPSAPPCPNAINIYVSLPFGECSLELWALEIEFRAPLHESSADERLRPMPRPPVRRGDPSLERGQSGSGDKSGRESLRWDLHWAEILSFYYYMDCNLNSGLRFPWNFFRNVDLLDCFCGIS